MLTRRSILKGFAAAPAVAPMAAREIANHSFSGLGLGLHSAAPVEPGGAGNWLDQCARRAGLGRQAWKLLNRNHDAAQRSFNASFMYRDGVLERDLACLQSTSVGYRLRLQEIRDRGRLKEIEDMRLRLWPRDDA